MTPLTPPNSIHLEAAQGWLELGSEAEGVRGLLGGVGVDFAVWQRLL